MERVSELGSSGDLRSRCLQWDWAGAPAEERTEQVVTGRDLLEALCRTTSSIFVIHYWDECERDD